MLTFEVFKIASQVCFDASKDAFPSSKASILAAKLSLTVCNWYKIFIRKLEAYPIPNYTV